MTQAIPAQAGPVQLYRVYAVVSGAPIDKVGNRMKKDLAAKKLEALQAAGVGRAYMVKAGKRS